MKEFLLLLLLVLLAQGHIYSSPPKVTYNYNGRPLYFSLYMSLERGIGPSDFLRLIFFERMYVTLKSQITVKLITFANNLQVATANCADGDGAAVTTLHVSFGYAMQPNTWYQVQVYPSQTVALTAPATFLTQVLAVSTFSANNIIYDSNMAFGYISVLDPLTTSNGLGIIANSSSSQRNVPAAIYSFDVYITPTVARTTGGNFTIYIYYDSGDGTHGTGTSLNDFTFMGLCQSAATVGNAAAVLNFCSISSDLSTITFSVNSVVAHQTIRISTSVSNPPYHSIRGIKGYWTEFISGRVLENGQLNNALLVNQINILTVTPRILLFWGIQSTYTDGTLTTPLPLFRAAGASPNILQYNSFNIGFSFASTSPITGQYTVQMTIGAQGVLQASIAHNLPAFSGSSVYCYYTSPNIICKNVGAFINTGFRYFISGKAFFSSSTVSPLTTFGAVSITPVAYDNNGNVIAGAQLYVSLAGSSTNVVASQEFLDTSGYHNTGLFRIGNTQVVSYNDDQSLSSTANAIQGFLQGTNSTIGVVPDLGTSQQLLFLLNTPTGSISSGGTTSYTIQLMFNNGVIGFETAGAGRGLDFVGYGTSGSVWSITTSPCFANVVVCEKYNNNTPTYNIKTLVNTGATTNFYGMYRFQCGSTYTSPSAPGCSSNCATQCNMFTGYSLTNTGSSVMAMRQVTLPSGYHTPIYADGNLLDFLFIFSQGASVMSYCLINGYTVTGARMQNIKAAYVNYFDNTAGAYNKGSRIPMMVRIAGGVLPSQSLSATAIGIFFDDNVDAATFYTSTGNSWELGCSTGSCSYFPNKNLNNVRMESWLTSRSIQVYSLPPIQNQFNILVPVTPDSTNRNPPRILTIAFFAQNYSVWGVTGLLQTLSVYRLFGPIVTGSLSGSIGNITGLARNSGGSGATPDIELSSSFSSFGVFDQKLNTTNMYSSPTNNTFTFRNDDNVNTFGTTFGAGYTITSFYYNIFASSTVQWNQPPANTATTCSIFGYVYNELVGGNAYKNGQWMYLAFCPIDSTFNIQSSAANIDFINPQYPNFFTNGFDLRSVLTIAYSSQAGLLRAYRRQNSPIATLVRSCTTAKLAPYNPSSPARQRAAFTLTTPAITMGSFANKNGYSHFRVQINIPGSTIASSGLTMLSQCDVSLSSVSCSVVSVGSNQITILISYTGTSTITITFLQINLYATSTGTFGTAAPYIVNIYLPQRDSTVSDVTPFGNAYNSFATYATCSSSFTVGITPYGTAMTLNAFSLNSNMNLARSRISFNFGASSFRDAFFATTSTFRFNFGFLTTPNLATWVTARSNFRCMIFQGPNATSMSLSSSWSTITLSSFTNVIVTPKTEIPNPASILYSMTCYGGVVPDGTNTTAISGQWMDNTVVQTSTGISYSPANYVATIPGSITTFALTYKRFSTSGFKSLYTFQIRYPTALSSSTVFYFDFHMALSPYLDNDGVVQCYLRTALVINDTAASYTYCTFVNPWQLMVWNNQNFAGATSFYVDIFNIDQPRNGDISGNSRISLSIDNDNNYSNGILAYRELTDTQPPTNAAADIIILTASVGNDFFILSTQTLTMTIDMQALTVFNAANNLFVLFPASYSQWIARAQALSITYPTNANTIYCEFNVTGQTTNLASSCTFISQRILRITVNAAAGQRYFSLRLMNIMTPASVPVGKFNQYRFSLFVSDASLVAITYFSFTDYSQHFSLTTNPNLISLSWNYYTLAVSDSMFGYTPQNNQVITIQQGYYSNAIQLRQSIYPSNFVATLSLTLANYAANYFSFLGGSLSVVLGKPLAYFRISGASAPPGLYTLVFTKSGDTNNRYTTIPPLTLVVQNTLCALTTDAATYTLPIGGSTLPILINAINCIPTNNITIGLTFTGSGNSEFSVNNDLSSLLLTSASVDGQIYIIVKHRAGSLVAGSSVTGVFNITGPNSAFYANIPSITLTLVDSTTFQTFPTATAPASPTLNANTATLQLQCSQASLVFWGIGVYPSILNYAAVDFEARIISGGNGLQTNFSEANDYFAKVYGIRQGTTMQVITKTLYHLQSNTNYLFKYFCVNQLGHISDSQSINFTSANYGAYLMKVEVTFRGSITYGQYNDLACSMAQNFIIPFTRVLTEAMSYCGNTPYTFYASSSAMMLNQPDSNGWYIYGFYIEPDYTLASDATNGNIRNQLSVSTAATTIITSTNNYINLPSLVQMQTYDIQIYTTPIMTISAPISGLTSVVLTAAITNMNGFIVIGVLNQAFNQTTMTIPSATNIKQGIFSQNVSLVAVQMIHATQNYNTTFQFTGLTANTLYSFFYFCTVEDPSITSLTSAVRVTSAQTLQMLTININWDSTLTLLILPFIVFLLL